MVPVSESHSGRWGSVRLDPVVQEPSLFWTSNWVAWVILSVGIVLRLRQYVFNRSLWLDESFLALNIIGRSFADLLQPLDYNQGAPIGFLMVERLAVQGLGNSEYALRLVPLLSGILALFLFYRVMRLCLERRAIPIALGLFALSSPLIYYSSEVKQYSSDVVIALLLYAVAIWSRAGQLATRRIFLFAVLGAAAVWFSHPSVFVLAGVGTVFLVFAFRRNEWGGVRRLLIVCFVWGISLVACYVVSLRALSEREVMLNLWDSAFAPFPPSSVSDFQWFVDTFFMIFEQPVGLFLSGIGGLAFVVGCTVMFPKKKETLFLLLSPIVFALLASALHIYPFRGRLILFIVPSLLAVIAEGVDHIRSRTSQSSPIIGWTLIGLLFFQPLLRAGHRFVSPQGEEEVRPVMSYIRQNWEAEDTLYLYHDSQYTFMYYSEQYGFDESDYVVGISRTDNWLRYFEDLDKLRGNRRVWILFSHLRTAEKDFFVHRLDSMGTRIDSIERKGAAAYLYDLSGAKD